MLGSDMENRRDMVFNATFDIYSVILWWSVLQSFSKLRTTFTTEIAKK